MIVSRKGKVISFLRKLNEGTQRTLLKRGVFYIAKKEEEDMAKEFAKQFYNSKAWKQCRLAYIAERVRIDGGLCESCGQRLGVIVHHKERLTQENINRPEISLNHGNLKLDCKECHDREDEHFVKKKKLLCRFDKNGNPIPLP